MNEQMLKKARAVLAQRRKAIVNAKDPRAVAKIYLQQAGYLDESGEVSQTFRGGITMLKPEHSSKPIIEKVLQDVAKKKASRSRQKHQKKIDRKNDKLVLEPAD